MRFLLCYLILSNGRRNTLDFCSFRIIQASFVGSDETVMQLLVWDSAGTVVRSLNDLPKLVCLSSRDRNVCFPSRHSLFFPLTCRCAAERNSASEKDREECGTHWKIHNFILGAPLTHGRITKLESHKFISLKVHYEKSQASTD